MASTCVSDTGLLTLLEVDGASVFRSHTLAPVMDLPKGAFALPPFRTVLAIFIAHGPPRLSSALSLVSGVWEFTCV